MRVVPTLAARYFDPQFSFHPSLKFYGCKATAMNPILFSRTKFSTLPMSSH